MVAYFVPISLLVLAAFGLGLFVGRMAWGSSRTSGAAEPSAETSTVSPKRIGRPTPEPTDESSPELPTWRMKEVRSRQRQSGVEIA